MEVETCDVIRVIQQFLAENNLTESLKALQAESEIYTNIEPKDFHQNISQGKWIEVLKDLLTLNIQPKHLTKLYEQIIFEFIEQNELDAARTILRQTEPIEVLRFENPDRYIYLESLVSRQFDAQSFYKKMSKTEVRTSIYKELQNHLTNVEQNRLLTLLSQSLKWQIHQNIITHSDQFNIFSGKHEDIKPQQDHSISTHLRTIKFPKKQHPESIKFSPCGKFFIIATFDGFVEVWNYMTGKLRKDIIYQQKDEMMMSESCALSMCFSQISDSKFLATGLQSGEIVVWNVYTGRIIKQFNAHTEGVTFLQFNNDDTMVLSSSFDHTIRLHGMKSGKTLKIFRGHSAFVNSCHFSSDTSKIISGSSDGTVKVWEVSTTECLHTVLLLDGTVIQRGVNLKAIHTIRRIPLTDDLFLVSNQSRFIYLVDINGKMVKSITTEVAGSNFVCATISQSGEFIYAADEDHKVYCFSTERGLLITKFGTGVEEIIGLEHHPLANILVVYSVDGKVEIFK